MPEPSQLTTLDEATLALEEAVAQLPADQRRVLELRFLERWPLDAIATTLQRSQVAVVSALRHGLRRLSQPARPDDATLEAPIDAILTTYLLGADSGQPADRAALLARYPEFA